MDQAPPSLPATMLAWTHSQAGSPSKVLSLSADVKTPTVQKPTDVLVRVSHASLNPGGLILLQLCPFFFRSKPSIPETDFSGEVVAAGPAALESGRISVGDSVFGSIGVAPHIKEGSGSLAEYVRVDMATLTRKPDRHATDAEVAGLGVAGCTAVALMEKAGLQTGNSVLVNGASGGIGSMVVQMARDEVGVNGRVVAICSGANATMARELGADEVSNLLHCSELVVFRPFPTRDLLISLCRSSITRSAIHFLTTSPRTSPIGALMLLSTLTVSKGCTAAVVTTLALANPSSPSVSPTRNTRIQACSERSVG